MKTSLFLSSEWEWRTYVGVVARDWSVRMALLLEQCTHLVPRDRVSIEPQW